jgi:hypothetical protein
MPAAETRLPLAGSHLDARVDEEDRHPGRDHERRPAPGPPVARVRGYRGRAIRAARGRAIRAARGHERARTRRGPRPLVPPLRQP